MDHLRSNRYRPALRLLREAQKTIEEAADPTGKLKLLAITLNNLGCYYKRTEKPLFALKYLHQALELESSPPVDHTNLAGTHLNICAIRSQLGKHESALSEALKALDILSENEEISPNSITTQAIAYHNAGVELEHLGRSGEAVEMFKVGWEYAREELGDTHPLSESLCKSYYRLLEQKMSGHHHRLPSRTTSGDSIDSTQGFDFLHKALRLYPKAAEETQETTKRKHRGTKTGRNTAKSRTLEQPLATYFPSPERGKGSTERSVIGGDIRFITGERKRPMFKMSFKSSPKPMSPSRSKRNPVHPAPPPVATKKLFNKVQRYPTPETLRLETKVQAMGQQLGNLMKRLEEVEAGSERKTQSTTPQKSMKRKNKGQKEEKATIVIQKWVRMFLAKRKYAKRKKRPVVPKAKPTPFPEIQPEKPRLQPLQKPPPKKDQKTTLFNAPPREEKPAKKAKNPPKRTSRDPNISIQSCVRGYLQRKAHLKLTMAAIMIQKHVRRYQCALLYKNIKAAIICIQVWWRGIRLQRRLKARATKRQRRNRAPLK